MNCINKRMGWREEGTHVQIPCVSLRCLQCHNRLQPEEGSTDRH